MITGPTRCGKTILLKAIIGELPCVSGFVTVESKIIVYCSQSTWTWNASIRENVCGLDVLACAVHSRPKILVTDDELSGLDGPTAETVFGRLLGHGVCCVTWVPPLY